MSWLSDIFGVPFEPDVFDVEAYEAHLALARHRKGTALPPPPIPGRVGRPWTDAEMEFMRINRERAWTLYKKIMGVKA